MRWLKFSVVGVMGLGVQLACLWLLRDGLGAHYLVAAAAATEAAVVHNFVWHVRWTWADRPASPARLVGRLVGFNLANGAISLVGSLVVMAALVELAGIHYLLASILSVGAWSLVNFVISDAAIFAAAPREPFAGPAAHELVRR